MAKLVAVGVPGCQTIARQRARLDRKLCFLVDFRVEPTPSSRRSGGCTRASGQLVFGEAIYHANPFRSSKYLETDPANPGAARLGLDRAFRGHHRRAEHPTLTSS